MECLSHFFGQLVPVPHHPRLKDNQYFLLVIVFMKTKQMLASINILFFRENTGLRFFVSFLMNLQRKRRGKIKNGTVSLIKLHLSATDFM